MAGMERFTQRARRVLSLAHQEAERGHQNSIGTEHLLLGLMEEEGGVAGRVLRELGLESSRVREIIERVSVEGRRDDSKIELAPDTQQVLEYAVDEARRLGHHYIGTEHILLGLVRVDATAMEVLRRLGVTADQIRRQTRRVLNETASSPASGSAQPASSRTASSGSSSAKTPLVDQLAADLTTMGWKRRSSAASDSMWRRYSSKVVAPM
ncbi:MAG TPA: Clp protease N-terminal domain-containing protein, partial [Anaerolineales bacterium]|nr:Clp protease N-terminal domain-containing protein [Anaerolineales bacterium]